MVWAFIAKIFGKGALKVGSKAAIKTGEKTAFKITGKTLFKGGIVAGVSVGGFNFLNNLNFDGQSGIEIITQTVDKLLSGDILTWTWILGAVGVAAIIIYALIRRG